MLEEKNEHKEDSEHNEEPEHKEEQQQKLDHVSEQGKADKDEHLKIPSQLHNTKERFRRQLQETGPINTVDNETVKFYENCINFPSKEEILNSLKRTQK